MTKNKQNKIHPDFLRFLELKEQNLIALYKDLRDFIMEIYPDTNELLYHTHALTSLYSISEKMSDGFCMIPIYNNHLNLGFNKGTLITDKNNLLTGTGKFMRHIPIKERSDFRNTKVKDLVKLAIDFAIEDMDKPTKSFGKIISKIKVNT